MTGKKEPAQVDVIAELESLAQNALNESVRVAALKELSSIRNTRVEEGAVVHFQYVVCPECGKDATATEPPLAATG
jgi:hypothetical protein